MRRKIAAGNWKMNGRVVDLPQLAEIAGLGTEEGPEVLICPPATLISRAADAARGTYLMIGGQDCHAAESGAHTGDVAADMLRDAGASHVILGHSERRTDHGRPLPGSRPRPLPHGARGWLRWSASGRPKRSTVQKKRWTYCGSNWRRPCRMGPRQRTTIVAYEPVWAIGTGLTPTTEEIGAVHGFLRAELVARFGAEIGSGIRLLYGGSVKPGNAAEIFAVAEVDGALVGGASLKAADFGPIVTALGEAG